jgi:hypothetical protein
MTDTYSTRTSSGSKGTHPASGGKQASGADQASDTYIMAADFGRSAADGAKQAASDAASSVRGEMRRMLDRQVDNGAAYLGHAASSIRTAAGDLSRTAPPLAGLADTVADKLDSYAQTVKGKTAEDVWDTAVDFTRRQPALVFGLASLAGFLAYRTIKNTQPPSSTSSTADNPAREFHGA